MFNFVFSLGWPSSKRGDQVDYFCEDWPVTRYKDLEIQVSKWGWYDYRIFGIDVDLSLWGQDHAGLRLGLDFFNYGIIISICDHRHWDHDTDKWEYWPGCARCNPDGPIEDGSCEEKCKEDECNGTD